jgi:hypothetical protein
VEGGIEPFQEPFLVFGSDRYLLLLRGEGRCKGDRFEKERIDRDGK